jgi:hypothetical protein
MRFIGFALLVVVLSSGAMAQVTAPATTKPVVPAQRPTVTEGVKPAPVISTPSGELNEVLTAIAKDKTSSDGLAKSARAPTAEEARLAEEARIRAQQLEAQQKAETAMQAATTNLAGSVASATVQVGSGVATPSGPAPKAQNKSPIEKPKP